MNEQSNPKRTEDDQSSLERRYAIARNVAVTLFVVVLLCFFIVAGVVFTGLFGNFESVPNYLFGILFGSVFLGIISGWTGVFFAIRALYFRGKLHFGANETITDSILAALVKRLGKHIPAGLANQGVSQESQRADADELAELRRELKELRRERENGNVKKEENVKNRVDD